MPIKFNGKDFEFEELVKLIKRSRPEIDNPEGFVKSLEDKQNAALADINSEYIMSYYAGMKQERALKTATASTFTKDGKNFAEFFLISDAENLKGWKVADGTVERYISTFKGRPFISEPELGHFGADFMPLDQVITKQEDFRVGDIVEVKFRPETMQATAIVEFHDTAEAQAIWDQMQRGEAIYVSPAVAGVSVRGERGPIFTQWFGLHLARVKSPAYGVHHASIKQTCTGPERECLNKLIASADVLVTPYKEETTSFCQMQQGTAQSVIDEKEKQNPMGNPKTGQEGQCGVGEHRDPETGLCVKTDSASVNKALAYYQSEMASLKTQIASIGKDSNVEKELAELKQKYATEEEEKKKELASAAYELRSELGLAQEDDEEKKKEMASLSQLSIPELQRAIADYKAIKTNAEKLTADLSKKTGSKIVKMPENAYEVSSASLEDIDYNKILSEMSR